MRDFSDSSFWDSLATTHGSSPESADYSTWTHERRMGKIRRILSNEGAKDLASEVSVLDIGCGTGSLLSMVGPFKSYIGVDFSEKALEVASQLGKQGDFIKRDLTTLNYSSSDPVTLGLGVDKLDFTLICGLTALEHLIPDLDTLCVMISNFKRNYSSEVLVNFAWSGHDQTSDIVNYSIDSVIESFIGNKLSPVVYFDYVPHEFMVKV